MRRLTLLLLLLFGCGPAMVIENVDTAPKKKAPRDVGVNYADLGHPVALNTQLEIKGVEPVWVEGTEFMLEIRTTKWDVLDGQREGRASLKVRNGKNIKVITIDEGGEKVVFGYRISVAYAYEFYNDADGSFVPHVKLTISR